MTVQAQIGSQGTIGGVIGLALLVGLIALVVWLIGWMYQMAKHIVEKFRER
jgi:hypothetical protein